jgi:hypothetical protein
MKRSLLPLGKNIFVFGIFENRIQRRMDSLNIREIG